MSNSLFKYKYLPYLLIYLALVSLVISLFGLSLGRGIFLIVSISVWFVSIILWKKPLLSSFLYILITLPFNITFLLPTSVVFLGTEILNIDPYVEGIYVNYIVPTISIIDLGLFLLLYSLIFERQLHLKAIPKRYSPYSYLFLLFLLIQNIYLSDILVLINSGRLLIAILAFVCLITVIREKKLAFPKRTVLWTLIVSVLFQGILGLLQFVRGASLGLNFLGESQVVSGMQGSSFISLNSELYLRAYGTFPHPNVLGGFLLLSFFFALFLLRNGEKSLRPYATILLVLSSSFLLITFARICIVIMFLTALIFGLQYLFSNSRKLLLSFSPLLLVERFSNLLTSGDSSFQDRINLLKASVLVIKENLLLGTGMGNFIKGMEGYVPRTSGEILLLQPVHNIFVLSFSEFGILGFLFFSLLLVKILFLSIKRISLFGIVLLCSYLFIGSFDHYLFSLPQGIAISLFFFLLLYLESDGLKKDEDDINEY